MIIAEVGAEGKILADAPPIGVAEQEGTAVIREITGATTEARTEAWETGITELIPTVTRLLKSVLSKNITQKLPAGFTPKPPGLC